MKLLGLTFLVSISPPMFVLLGINIDLTNVIYLLKIFMVIYLLLYFKAFNGHRKLKAIIIVFYLIFLIRGIINENWYKYIVVDSIYYLSILTIFICAFKDNFNYLIFKIPNYFTQLLVIGFVLTTIYAIYFGLRPASFGERYDFELYGPVGFSVEEYLNIPIKFSVLLLPFAHNYILGKKRIFVFASVILYLIIGLFSGTRTTVVLSLISVILYLINSPKRTYLTNILLTLSIFFLSSYFLFILFGYNSLKDSFENLQYRLFDVELLQDRSFEQEAYLKSISTEELLLGKGIGGANKSGWWESSKHGVNMIHRGYLNLILKGGILFALVFYSIQIYAFIKIIRKGKVYWPFAFIILMYNVYEIGHELFSDLIYGFLLYYSISVGLFIEKYSATEKIRQSTNNLY
jgi:hypothetical protein